jgi:hypothetical protein
VHPDAGGDHEAFLFVTAVRETLEALPSRCSCNPLAGQHNRRHAGQSAYIREAPYTADATARVPFSAPVNHGALLDLAVREGKRRTDEIGALLTMLASYKQNTSGRHQPAEQRGSTFKQLKYLIKVSIYIGWRRCKGVYVCAEELMLSQASVAYLIDTLKEEAR